jgi:PAS domain S-box-containing protein
LGADIKSKDELGLLAEGFNEMLSQIRNRDIELEQHGKFLENLVNQRTFEISQINEQLKTELTEHQQTGKALRELEQKYYNLFDNLNDAAFLTEVETGNITETNKQGEVLLGMTRDEIVGMKRWTLCRPEDGEELKKMFLQRENSFQGPDILNVRTVICRNKSEAVPVEISSSFVQIGDKHILLELFRDVTEHIKVENQIRASLEEKEVLLKEIHHRVKNNMQIITSLINLQLENTKEAQTVEIFKNCVNRIKSMALIHEKLYQSKDLTRIDFADYVNKLIDYLFYTYHVNSDTVKFRVSIKDIFLRINTAIPCGLIISELVSNSLKYAFKDRKDNEIEIDFFREREILPTENNNRYTLIVKDNGAGLPVGIDIKNTKTLGLRLVHSLSIQLGGTIGLIRDKGTEFKITFTLHD